MRWFIVLVLALTLTVGLASSQTIVGSKHDLSSSSTGTYHSTDEDQVCIFCHTPHHASTTQTPLWNRTEVTTSYPTYSSPTIDAYTTAPDVGGSSLLCLSCHDGITALNSLLYTHGTTPTMTQDLITGDANLVGTPGGAEMTNDHPVSFHYEDAITGGDGELVDATTISNLGLLDESGDMQCASCHDVHDPTNEPFLTIDNTGSALCLTCHVK
jgi:predicted CXXCH cytochrome family protein